MLLCGYASASSKEAVEADPGLWNGEGFREVFRRLPDEREAVELLEGDCGMLENLMWLIAGVALGFIFEEIRYAPEDPEEDER